MKSLLRNRLFLFTFVLFALLLTACSSATTSEEEEDGRIKVVSTVSPLTNIIYNIGGDKIDLRGIIPEGVNSHTFEPAPSDAIKLSEADLIFINGLNLEIPSLRLAEANLKEGGKIVILGERTIDPEAYVYDFSFPEASGNPNPHLWTNPIYALKYAEIVRDELVARDPDNADTYNSNYDVFASRIADLDEAIKATAASIPDESRKLLTYHDSFAYFAPRYDFEIIGAIQPASFSEPSAQEVAGLIEQLRAENVPAIFGSGVFPSPVLDQIGREAGVSYVNTLRDDDLPGEPGDAEHSYIGLMIYDLKIMASALGGDPTLMDSVDGSNVTGVDTAVDQAQ